MSAVRPLAIITLLLGALFTLKALAFADGASLFFEARAEARESAQGEEAAAADQPAPPQTEAPASAQTPPPPAVERQPIGPAPEESGSARRDDLLVALAARRRALDARERELDTREGLIEVAEQRVEARIARLDELHGEVQALLGQLDTERQAEVDSLVATYATLEPEAAAIILRQMDAMDEETLLLVARELQTTNTRKFAAIVGELADIDPGFAARLTSRLRARSMPPETVAQLEAELDAAAN